MSTSQGSVSLLNDPVAQDLLKSNIPARLAYVWKDGTPRVVPIWFHWDGEEIVMASPMKAPKVKVIDGTKVAITIDANAFPYKILYIRGTARVTVVDGVASEYKLAAKRYFGPEGGEAWVKQIEPVSPQMARISVKPEWVGVLDLETRFPSAMSG